MDQLKYWDKLLSKSNFFIDILHWLGWGIVKGLQALSNIMETLVDEMYRLLDFTTYIGVDKFFSDTDFKILLTILFVFALIVLAWTLIFNSKDSKPKVMQQLCIIVLVLTGLPTMFNFLNEITVEERAYIQGTSSTNISDEILTNAITDLKYIDSMGFENYSVEGSMVTGKNGKNGFSGNNIENIGYIDPTEKITDESDINNEDILLKKLTTTDNGTLTVAEIEGYKFLGIDMTDWYYRYHIDYLSIYIALLATIITYLLTAWKIGQIIYEIAFHKLMAVFMSVSDLTTGQRIKTVFKSLGSLYTVLLLLPILLRIFVFGQSYIMSKIPNTLIASFALLCLAFFIVQGPNIIERCLSVDAGVKSGFQTLFTGYMAARSALAIGRTVGRGTATVLGGAAGAMKGGVQNGIEGYRISRDRMNSGTDKGGIHTGNNSMDNNISNSTENIGAGKSTNNDAHGINNSEKEKNSSTETGTISELSSQQQEGGLVNEMPSGIENSEIYSNAPNTLLNQPDNNGQGISKGVQNSIDGQGISKGVQNSIDDKKKASSNDSDNLRRSHYQSNPNGIIGRTKRSYNNGEAIGGAIGNKIGRGIGKIGNKIDRGGKQ